MVDSIADQVYRGAGSWDLADRAIRETRGELVSLGREPAEIDGRNELQVGRDARLQQRDRPRLGGRAPVRCVRNRHRHRHHRRNLRRTAPDSVFLR